MHVHQNVDKIILNTLSQLHVMTQTINQFISHYDKNYFAVIKETMTMFKLW